VTDRWTCALPGHQWKRAHPDTPERFECERCGWCLVRAVRYDYFAVTIEWTEEGPGHSWVMIVPASHGYGLGDPWYHWPFDPPGGKLVDGMGGFT
jgi:hypothetical protein